MPITEYEDDHVIGKDHNQSSRDGDNEGSRQNVMEGQQEISELSNVRLQSRRKKQPNKCYMSDNEIGGVQWT